MAPNATLPIEMLVERFPNLAGILHVRCPMIAVLAEKEMPLEAVLELGVGSVIVFSKNNADPIALHVNNVAVGCGKTIKVGDHFGLHLRNYSQESVVGAMT
ncbi:MAG: FliM/FliN family flagellar motor C-terminal domain-containing protein [Planctomycetes bacterium]|nr:FliM/FliN family flagellar motor C-terminal domain-containing protein [Planctomycetota bacterium]